MTPDLRFCGQPFRPDDAAARFLEEALSDVDTRRLLVAVAWARSRGLIRFASALEAFRTRGGHAKLLVGIDEGVATRPGLELALELFDEVSIVHDTGGRTFHPKVYLVEGATAARLLVGSSNLTAGGLYFNFEASTEARFALPEEQDHPALVGVHEFFRALEADAATRPLTHDRLEALMADPRFRIAATERRTDRRSTVAGVDADELDAELQDGLERVVFARSSGARSLPPRLDRRQRQRLRDLEPEAPRHGPRATARTTPGGRTAPTPAGEVVASWSKQLSASDAQHPPGANSKRTGALRLAQEEQPIDSQTWFRNELFGRCWWPQRTTSNGRPVEWTAVPMDVTVRGTRLGMVDLEIDHAVHREAGQGNVPTILHWGSLLAPLLRQTNMTGATVTIERLATGSFRLLIA